MPRNIYLAEIVQRSNVDLQNLPTLCKDIPNNIFQAATSEIFYSNDYYGNAEQIKRFLNLPSDYSLKASIQHGNQYGHHYWAHEISPELPVSLAWGDHIYETWREKTEKKLFKIGAPFFYTRGLLSAEETAAEKKRLGTNVLIFPAHSMASATLAFDMEWWLQRIAALARRFASIRICIYWKDYLLGLHKPYLEAGYECVTAGHIYDPNFLPRLYSLIEISDATASNRIGSFIGYSLFLQRPHMYFDQPVSIEQHFTNQHGGVIQEEKDWRSDPGVQKIHEVFSRPGWRITDEHWQCLEPYFGFREIKSKASLRGILMLAEQYCVRNAISCSKGYKKSA